MYHITLRGTHYEAGFQWGSLLREHGNIISDAIPFAITGDRLSYAEACLPVYERYYPEIAEEIRGMADGQQCDPKILQAVLFSMYAIPPSCCCSCLAFTAGDEILFGRSSDFLTALEEQNCNVLYALSDGAYSLTGNTTAFIELEDGVNEHGLAIGLTSVYSTRRKPGFTAGLLLRYLLEKCRTVDEAIRCAARLPIGSAQTLTLADPSGDVAVIECSCERFEFARPTEPRDPFVCAVNEFHLPLMEPCNTPGIDNWRASERYRTMESALCGSGERGFSVDEAKKLLSGGYGFLCQYDRAEGRDTVWSVIYDLRRRRIFRSEGNPMWCGYQEDTRFRF